MSQPARRVAIVGGGLAGISAALHCADAGGRVTLVEVRPRLGGAAYSFERGGLRLDNGQHVFLRCCEQYLGLLDRLGVRSSTTLQRRLDVPVIAPGGRIARLRRAPLPAPLHLAPSLARYGHLSTLDRARAARAAVALRRLDPGDSRLDERTLADWLSDHGQRGPAIELLWEVIARPTLNLRPRDASLAQAAQVFRTGLLTAAPAGDVGWSLVPLGDLHDAPARRALAGAGVEVRLGWRAERVQRGADGWAVEGPAGRINADAVIVAVPHDRAGRIMPPGALAAPERLAALSHSPILNLHIAYDRPIARLRLAVAVHSPVQWVFDRTRSAGLRRGQLLALSLSAAEQEIELSHEQLRRRYLPALAALFPAARSANVTQFVVTREHAATFRAAPGAATLRPRPHTLLPGLSLAGAYTATGWPATMEGAVRSGLAAARAALSPIRSIADSNVPRPAEPRLSARSAHS